MPINLFLYFGSWIIGALLVGFFIFRSISRRLSGGWVLLIWLLNLPLGFFVAMSLEQVQLHLSISVLLLWGIASIAGIVGVAFGGKTNVRPK